MLSWLARIATSPRMTRRSTAAQATRPRARKPRRPLRKPRSRSCSRAADWTYLTTRMRCRMASMARSRARLWASDLRATMTRMRTTARMMRISREILRSLFSARSTPSRYAVFAAVFLPHRLVLTNSAALPATSRHHHRRQRARLVQGHWLSQRLPHRKLRRGIRRAVRHVRPRQRRGRRVRHGAG